MCLVLLRTRDYTCWVGSDPEHYFIFSVHLQPNETGTYAYHLIVLNALAHKEKDIHVLLKKVARHVSPAFVVAIANRIRLEDVITSNSTSMLVRKTGRFNNTSPWNSMMHSDVQFTEYRSYRCQKRNQAFCFNVWWRYLDLFMWRRWVEYFCHDNPVLSE